jgi:hypothetical protein
LVHYQAKYPSANKIDQQPANGRDFIWSQDTPKSINNLYNVHDNDKQVSCNMHGNHGFVDHLVTRRMHNSCQPADAQHQNDAG